MALDPATSPPSEFRAGDSFSWQIDLSDTYPPADGWSLKYTLVGTGGAFTLTASTAGALYQVDVDPATSIGWPAGQYSMVEYVAKTGKRVTLNTYSVKVLPDLAVSGATDTRTHARKVLDSINAWLEGKSLTAGEVQIGDRRVRQYSITELLALRDRYAVMVAGEESGQPGVVRRMLVRL